MKDPRIADLADVLVHYCLEMKRDDLFLINSTPIAAPLVLEVVRVALEAGAHPVVRLGLPGHAELFYKTAKKHQLEYVNPISEFEVERIDKRLAIRAADNTKSLTNVDPSSQAIARKAGANILKRFMERSAAGDLMWCGTQYPCQASAQDAEMSLEEYEDFVLKACLVHRKDPVKAWIAVRRRQAKLCKLLGSKKQLRIVSDGTDITMSVEGRTWINSDGKHNMPSGEVFTGPVEDSVNGRIAFSFPACYGGREVHGVVLEFKDGVVVKATAEKGAEFLHATLDTDEGARRVGEIAFGTNASIQNFTKNTLFDEKIGGTIHMAVGASYPDSGGVNQSAVHWDMVNDMRKGGVVYGDGRKIYEDGTFLE
jgi:aminopeptidase